LGVTTLFDHYGSPADQKVADVTWLTDATQRGWLCLMKDRAIARNSAERSTVVSVGARCFCLTRQSLTAAVMAGWYLAAMDEIRQAVDVTPAPFIFGVERGGLRRIL
jgi:hypothetical protein